MSAKGQQQTFGLIRQAVYPLASFARIERDRSGRYRMADAVNLPSRIVDISSPLDNETVLDHPFMRPKVEYRTNVQNAPMLLENFPGLKQKDLPGGEGWAFEIVTMTTHNGTHMDAPVHF